MQTQLKNSALILGALAGVSAYASTDYGPAIYRPMSGCSKWYTTGSGHKFVVCHDMEGYYLSSIAYLQRCDISVSVHYAVNGKVDNSSDAQPGEVRRQANLGGRVDHVRANHTTRRYPYQPGRVFRHLADPRRGPPCSADQRSLYACQGGRAV